MSFLLFWFTSRKFAFPANNMLNRPGRNCTLFPDLHVFLNKHRRYVCLSNLYRIPASQEIIEKLCPAYKSNFGIAYSKHRIFEALDQIAIFFNFIDNISFAYFRYGKFFDHIKITCTAYKSIRNMGIPILENKASVSETTGVLFLLLPCSSGIQILFL